MLNKEILLKFCEGVQVDNVNAYFDNNCSYAAAAKSLGKTPKALRMSIVRAEK